MSKLTPNNKCMFCHLAARGMLEQMYFCKNHWREAYENNRTRMLEEKRRLQSQNQ